MKIQPNLRTQQASTTQAPVPSSVVTPATTQVPAPRADSGFAHVPAGQGTPAPSSRAQDCPASPMGLRMAQLEKLAATGAAQNGNYVICPVIGSLIDEGSLHKDADGNISLKELDDLMIHRLGITPERAAVTVATGFAGNHVTDALKVASGKLNVEHLKGSLLDHQGKGDTGILQGGKFHEGKFQALVAHSKDGKTMTIQDFSEAIRRQLARDGGLDTHTRGASEDVFEMAALINTFGYVDDKGERRIGIDTLRSLYQDRTLPSKEQLTARAPTGITEHVETMAKMALAPGEKSEKAEKAESGAPKAAAQGAPGGLAMAMCPFMAKMGKTGPAEQ